MNPSAVPVTSPGGALSSAIAAIFGVGFVSILFLIAFVLIAYYIYYRIVKAAVRNGMIEALNKTGNSGFGSGSSGSSYVAGYPPPQDFGPPPAPGYRGPNG